MNKFLKKYHYNYKKNFPLKSITTIKNNYNCKYYVIIENFFQLIKLLEYLTIKKKKYFIIGNGSKLVFKKRYNGTIISLKNLNKVRIKNLIEVEAGCLIYNLITILKKYGYGGIEQLIGIPSTIGGALYNNSSAHNVALSDYLESIIVLKDNKIKKINKKDIIFKYRFSSLKDCIILKAYFNFPKSDINVIKNNILIYQKYRRIHQEVTYPNIGSIFKNNEKTAVQIIKECHLEKYKYKNVTFSKKHVNFLLIKGKTKGKNVYKFVKKVQKKVFKLKKIELKSEIIFI